MGRTGARRGITDLSPESPRFAAFVATAFLAIMLTPAVAARGRLAIGKLFLHRREWGLAALIERPFAFPLKVGQLSTLAQNFEGHLSRLTP